MTSFRDACARCWGFALLATGCATEPEPPVPEITSVTAVAGVENALSALVTVEAQAADSAKVRYRPLTEPSRLDSTPAVPFDGLTLELPVLGMRAETVYQLELVAYRGTALTVRDAGTVATGTLPDDLPAYEAGGDAPAPGFVVFAAGRYGLIIDNTGRVVWYHRFPNGPGLNFMPQPNGRFVARPPTPDPSDQEAWIEVDFRGRVTRTLPCHGGLTTRPHDMIALPDGSYWLLCDDARTIDLRELGGLEHAQVTGTAVQHVGPAGELLFQWTPFDHFALADIGAASLASPSINWTHGNALDIAPDGNLVVSFRNLNEITAIDIHTGHVLWRLGGARSDFTFVGSSLPPFVGQHGLRVVGSEIQLLDNLGNGSTSRVERYRLDLHSRTASLASAFQPSVPVIAQLGGNTQTLANGHTLVSFGNGGRVEEFDAAGRVVWQILSPAGYVFRAQRIHSLYSPGVGDR